MWVRLPPRALFCALSSCTRRETFRSSIRGQSHEVRVSQVQNVISESGFMECLLASRPQEFLLEESRGEVFQVTAPRLPFMVCSRRLIENVLNIRFLERSM